VRCAKTRSGGRVWSIAAALKAAGPFQDGPGGSNPSRSASASSVSSVSYRRPRRALARGTRRSAPPNTGPYDAAVPNIVGLAASEASPKLREAKLRARIRLVASSRAEGMLAQAPEASPRIDAGTTVELRVTQSPSPGARVGKGTTVSLTVSSGQAQSRCPKCPGSTKRARAGATRGRGIRRLRRRPAHDGPERGRRRRRSEPERRLERGQVLESHYHRKRSARDVIRVSRRPCNTLRQVSLAFTRGSAAQRVANRAAR
jgi:PASTA domain